MDSDRIDSIERRTRLGYISLSEDEEQYARSTTDKMIENGFRVGKNLGGKFSRIAILVLCDLYNSGKFNQVSGNSNEECLRINFVNALVKNSNIK